MLSVSILKNSAACVQYQSEAHDAVAVTATSGQSNYYSEDGKAVGQWIGSLAQSRGLIGAVNPDILKEALDGKLGEQTAWRYGKDVKARVGFDLTFTAPKSASILAEVYGDTRIHDAMLEATKRVFAHMERHEIGTRIKSQRVISYEKTGNLCAAAYMHKTSRPTEKNGVIYSDPSLHVHAVVSNLTESADGKLRATHTDSFYNNVEQIQSIFHDELAIEMRKLGYDLDMKIKDGRIDFDIKGVSREAIDLFSKRSEQIKAAQEAATTEWEKRNANILTRLRKEKIDHGDNIQSWKSQLKALGQDFEPLFREAKETELPNVSDTKLERATLDAVKTLSEEDPTFSVQDIIEQTKANLPGQVSHKEVEYKIDDLVEQGKLIQVKVNASARGFSAHYITIEEFRRTERIINTVKAGIGIMAPLAASIKEARTAICKHEGTEQKSNQSFKLNEGQAQALENILQSTDLVSIVEGRAGTGKTTILKGLQRYVNDIRDNDARFAHLGEIVGVAPSAAAASNLEQDSGIASSTTDSFFIRTEKALAVLEGLQTNDKLSPKQVELKDKLEGELMNRTIVVDEAGMVSADHWQRLVDQAAKTNSRIVAVGDRAQLQSVDGRQAFGWVTSTGTNYSLLSEIMRQKGNEQYLEAVNNIYSYYQTSRNEDIQAFFEKINTVDLRDPESGIAASREDIVKATFEHVVKELQAGTEINNGLLVLSLDNQTRYELNEMIQGYLKEQGKLGGEAYEIRGEHGDFAINSGDQIVFTKNDKKEGINNSDIATIKSVDAGGTITATLHKNNEEITFKAADQTFDLAYSMTTHKSQGQTVDRVVAAGYSKSRLMDTNALLVQATRGRENFTFITDSVQGTIQALQSESRSGAISRAVYDTLSDENNVTPIYKEAAEQAAYQNKEDEIHKEVKALVDAAIAAGEPPELATQKAVAEVTEKHGIQNVGIRDQIEKSVEAPQSKMDLLVGELNEHLAYGKSFEEAFSAIAESQNLKPAEVEAISEAAEKALLEHLVEQSLSDLKPVEAAKYYRDDISKLGHKEIETAKKELGNTQKALDEIAKRYEADTAKITVKKTAQKSEQEVLAERIDQAAKIVNEYAVGRGYSFEGAMKKAKEALKKEGVDKHSIAQIERKLSGEYKDHIQKDAGADAQVTSEAARMEVNREIKEIVKEQMKFNHGTVNAQRLAFQVHKVIEANDFLKGKFSEEQVQKLLSERSGMIRDYSGKAEIDPGKDYELFEFDRLADHSAKLNPLNKDHVSIKSADHLGDTKIDFHWKPAGDYNEQKAQFAKLVESIKPDSKVVISGADKLTRDQAAEIAKVAGKVLFVTAPETERQYIDKAHAERLVDMRAAMERSVNDRKLTKTLAGKVERMTADLGEKEQTIVSTTDRLNIHKMTASEQEKAVKNIKSASEMHKANVVVVDAADNKAFSRAMFQMKQLQDNAILGDGNSGYKLANTSNIIVQNGDQLKNWQIDKLNETSEKTGIAVNYLADTNKMSVKNPLNELSGGKLISIDIKGQFVDNYVERKQRSESIKAAKNQEEIDAASHKYIDSLYKDILDQIKEGQTVVVASRELQHQLNKDRPDVTVLHISDIRSPAEVPGDAIAIGGQSFRGQAPGEKREGMDRLYSFTSQNGIDVTGSAAELNSDIQRLSDNQQKLNKIATATDDEFIAQGIQPQKKNPWGAVRKALDVMTAKNEDSPRTQTLDQRELMNMANDLKWGVFSKMTKEDYKALRYQYKFISEKKGLDKVLTVGNGLAGSIVPASGAVIKALVVATVKTAAGRDPFKTLAYELDRNPACLAFMNYLKGALTNGQKIKEEVKKSQAEIDKMTDRELSVAMMTFNLSQMNPFRLFTRMAIDEKRAWQMADKAAENMIKKQIRNRSYSKPWGRFMLRIKLFFMQYTHGKAMVDKIKEALNQKYDNRAVLERLTNEVREELRQEVISQRALTKQVEKAVNCAALTPSKIKSGMSRDTADFIKSMQSEIGDTKDFLKTNINESDQRFGERRLMDHNQEIGKRLQKIDARLKSANEHLRGLTEKKMQGIRQSGQNAEIKAAAAEVAALKNAQKMITAAFKQEASNNINTKIADRVEKQFGATQLKINEIQSAGKDTEAMASRYAQLEEQMKQYESQASKVSSQGMRDFEMRQDKYADAKANIEITRELMNEVRNTEGWKQAAETGELADARQKISDVRITAQRIIGMTASNSRDAYTTARTATLRACREMGVNAEAVLGAVAAQLTNFAQNAINQAQNQAENQGQKQTA